MSIPSNLGMLLSHSVPESCPTWHPHKDSVASHLRHLTTLLSLPPAYELLQGRAPALFSVSPAQCLPHTQLLYNQCWLNGCKLGKKTELKTVTSWKDSHLTKFSIYMCRIINAFTENNMKIDIKMIVDQCFLTMGQDRSKIF